MNSEITINLKTTKDNDENNIQFEIKGDEENGLNKTVVNSIRRTLLSDIPTVGFRTLMESKDIHITTNNTSLHNEFLETRISLVPLFINPYTYKKQYLFKLKVDSSETSEPFKKVYMNDFDIYPLKEGADIDKINDEENIDQSNYDFANPVSEEGKKQIFRPFIYNGKDNYCLLTELKTTSSSNKQELELIGVPRVSTASEDAKWQSVSCATYSFKNDEELFEKVITEKIKVNEIEEDKQEEYKNSMRIAEAERYYHRDNNCEPYWYDFQIDSVHYLPSKDLFLNSCQIIIDKLELLKSEFPKIISGEESIVELKVDQNVYTIYIDGFTDTIGSIIQSYISTHLIDDDDSDFMVCGYKRVHPLEELIKFNISFNETKESIKTLNNQQKLTSLIKLFEDSCLGLITVYTSIKQEADNKL